MIKADKRENRSRFSIGKNEFIRMFIGIALIPFVSNAESLIVTNTLDGVSCYPASTVKWQIKIDTEAKTAQLGLNQDGVPGGSWEGNTALAIDNTSKITIPVKFMLDGVDYAVTEIEDRAFLSNNDGTIGSLYLKDLTILKNITYIRRRCFYKSRTLENVLLKGPNTDDSNGTQETVTIGFGKNGSNGDANTWWPFSYVYNLKFFVVGPHCRTGGSRTRFGFPQSSAGVTVLLPDSSVNTTWRGSAIDTNKDNVVWYGPDYDFDMTMSDTSMTFFPKNEIGLTNVLAWASTIKSAFDMDVVVNITNRIEISEGVSITEAMLQNVTLQAPAWYLRFAVTTQAQLDNVLEAVDAKVPILLDISGSKLATEIKVPEGREVAICCPGGWTFGRKINGLLISIH